MYHNKQRLNLSNYVSVINLRFLPVLLLRLSHFFKSIRLISKFFSFMNLILFGCDISISAKIKGGIHLPHPQGVVIGKYVKIGKNCVVHQGVTLGAKSEKDSGNPEIKNFVEIGTGAKLLGTISVGDYAVIGANSVILKSVKDRQIVVGNPARVIKTREDI